MKLSDDAVRFNRLRWKVNETIRKWWSRGEPGKTYEGEWEVTCSYDGADAGDTLHPTYWKIVLHCYLIGPNRHYSWDGRTFADALKKCEYDVTRWCEEADDGEEAE